MVTSVSDDSAFVQVRSAQWVYKKATEEEPAAAAESLESEDKTCDVHGVTFILWAFPTWLQRSRANTDMDGDLEGFSQEGDYLLGKFLKINIQQKL